MGNTSAWVALNDAERKKKDEVEQKYVNQHTQEENQDNASNAAERYRQQREEYEKRHAQDKKPQG